MTVVHSLPVIHCPRPAVGLGIVLNLSWEYGRLDTHACEQYVSALSKSFSPQGVIGT